MWGLRRSFRLHTSKPFLINYWNLIFKIFNKKHIFLLLSEHDGDPKFMAGQFSFSPLSGFGYMIHLVRKTFLYFARHYYRIIWFLFYSVFLTAPYIILQYLAIDRTLSFIINSRKRITVQSHNRINFPISIGFSLIRVILYNIYKLRGLSPQANYTDLLSDRRLSAKLVPTLADRGCRVVSATIPPQSLISVFIIFIVYLKILPVIKL
jgi:hypothetical protein